MEKTTGQAVQEKKDEGVSDKQDRFVLLVDIMGFSAFVQSTPFGEAIARLKGFRESLDRRTKNLAKGGHLKFAFFSDSILVVTEGDTQEDLNRISKAGVVLMQESFKNGFAIKGCLAHGEFHYDSEASIFFGLPLVDAYRLGDQELKYYGIVVHHTAEKMIRELNEQFKKQVKGKEKTQGNNPYIYSKIPLKSSGWSCHCHLAWNLYDKTLKFPVDNTPKCKLNLEEIELTVSGAPRIYIDNTREVMERDQQLYDKKKGTEEGKAILFPIREES